MKNILRHVGNSLVGREKVLEERLDGLEGVYSLLNNTSETLFEIKYNDRVKTYTKEHVYPKKIVEFISEFVEIYPNVKLECSHTIFSGPSDDKHYIDIKKFHPSWGKYELNRLVKIKYFTK